MMQPTLTRTLKIGKRYRELVEAGLSSKDAVAKVKRIYKTKLSYKTVVAYGSMAKKAGVVPKEKRPRPKKARMEVFISRDLCQNAVRYSREHRDLTGGSFSGFVELLIWERLGKPEKHVVTPDELAAR